MPQVSAREEMLVVMEVHIGDENIVVAKPPRFQSAGWCYFHLFGEGNLVRGYHKLRLLAGPFSPAAFDNVLKQASGKRPPLNGGVLYMRIFTAGEDIPEIKLQEPSDSEGMYLTPRTRQAKGPAVSEALRGPTPISLGPTMIATPVGIAAAAAASAPNAVADINTRRRSSLTATRASDLNQLPIPQATVRRNSAQDNGPKSTPNDAILTARARRGLNPGPAMSRTDSQKSVVINDESTGSGKPTASSAASHRTSGSSKMGVVPEGEGLLFAGSEGLLSAQESVKEVSDGRRASRTDDGMKQMQGEGGEIFIHYRRDFTGDKNPDLMTPGDGANIYIDGARGLPDNVTITRLTARILSSQNKQIGNDLVSYSDVDGCRAFPCFNLFHELREDVFDPTLIMLIRIDTLDKYLKAVVCVGYAVLNIFALPHDPLAQPETGQVSSFILNEGAFQIPIHLGQPNIKGNLNKDCLKSVKKLPCATLLCRILPAPRTEDGLGLLHKDDFPRDQWEKLAILIPAPDYSSKVYDSTRCAPSTIEEVIYQRRGRSDSNHAERLKTAIAEAFPANAPQGSETEKITAWMTASFEGVKPTNFMTMSHLLRYQPDIGFKVSIDGLCNLPSVGLLGTAKLYKVVFCLSPPALYYSSPPVTTDAHFTRAYVSNLNRHSVIDNTCMW